MPILLEVVAPDREVVVSRVQEVGAPGIQGDFGVLPGHTPFLTLLRPGILWYRTDEGRRQMVVRRGYVEVRPDRVVVLADGCYLREELDRETVALELREAEEAAKRASTEGGDLQVALENVLLAQAKQLALET
jgi:F-type H+-transporting ATPase subunit epsilon